MTRTIKAADLFCGAGGTSSGMVEACSDLGIKVDLTAINHWDIAVNTHSQNHPDSRHLCASLDSLNPRDLFGDGELDMLLASPECTHHSIARGGKPINDQSRATAWCVIRWADALRPSIILVENVKEFLKWGPTKGGKKEKDKLGATFLSWVENLRSFGYRVEWRVLCAADYGDPTTRKRLFVYAVRGKRKIVWPEPSHIEVQIPDMFTQRLKWLTARDHVIDWAIPGQSIFTRKRPLADKTLRRIRIGLEKFGLKPFTIHMEHQGSVRDVNKPLRGTNDAADIDKPAPAVTAGGQHLGLAEPYLIQVNHGNGKDANGDVRRVRTTDKPLPVVTGNRGEWALCQPFIVPQFSDQAPRSIDKPLNSVTTTSRGIAVVSPYLVHYYGSSDAYSVDEPLGTVTTNDRFGLVMPILEIEGEKYLLDIRFRMLKPQELAAAQGFPRDYKFTGNTTQVVKQIGNAVPKNLAKALVRAALTQSSI